MPNTGRPSRDCYSCRQRRIKCDLEYPECNQCLRKSWQCQGYRDETDVRFRTETVTSFSNSLRLVHRKASRQRRENKETSSHATQTETRTSSSQTLPSHLQPVKICKSVMENVENHLIPIALTTMRISGVMSSMIIETMSQVAMREKHGSALTKAFNALGCAYLAKMHRSQSALGCRIRLYRNALTELNASIRDANKCHTDSTLLAVWMLATYEAVAAPTTAGWHIHSEGLIKLFQSRGPLNYATECAKSLFLIVFNILHLQTVRTGRESYITNAVSLRQGFADNCLPSEHVPLRSCLFAYHCALICCQIQRLLSTGDQSELLSSSTSIFQDMETVEGKTYPLSHKEFITNDTIMPPHRESHSSQNNFKEDNNLVDIDAQHRGSLMYRTNWRIRLSLHVLRLLQRLSSIEGCEAAQLNFYSQYQLRCIDELRVLVERASAYLAPPPHSINSPSELVSHIKNVLLPRTGPVEDVQDFVITE